MRANAAFGVTASPVLRIEPRSGSRRFARVPTFADDWDQCPACGFILVACDCDDFTRGERK